MGRRERAASALRPQADREVVARAARPDVLLMQETKLADAEAPAGVFREAGRWGIKSRQGVRETCRPAAGVPVSSVTLPRFP
jgi:exonuclease III